VLSTMRNRVWPGVSKVAGVISAWLRVWLRERKRGLVARRKMRNRRTYALVGTLALLGGVLVWSLSYLAPSPSGMHITVDQLSALAGNHRVVSATFHDEDAQIVGTFSCDSAAVAASNAPAPAAGTTASSLPSCADASGYRLSAATSPRALTPPDGKGEGTVRHFWLSISKSNTTVPEFMNMLTASGARVVVDPQTSKGNVKFFASLILPLMILANLFVLFFTSGKGSGSGIGEVELFSSIGKGRFSRRRKAPLTFADVAGADEALEELKEVRDYLANPERYKDLGALPPKGVLLIGPPGCGKTLIAKAVAGEVGVPFFSVAGAEFVESLVGVGAARVRDLFRRVRAVAPAVLFIDELDAAGRKRATGGGGGGNEEREQTLNQILVEMDGFDAASGIVVMGATNRPDILDPALLRPGRFDRHITVERPDLLGRSKILELHSRGKAFSVDVDFGQVARRTPGFSGADLANVINESALLSIRQGKPEIEPGDIEEGIQRTLMGTARKSRVLTPEERKRAAYHESGHVVVAAATGRTEQIHRVSILEQGRNIGSTSFRADSEDIMLTRSHLQNRLMVHLGGVAAEELVFGEPSTGSEDDLKSASDLARDIAARFGMSEKLGRMRLLGTDVDAFLDAEVPLAPMSGSTHQDLDSEIRRLLADAERDATGLLLTHRATLDALAARLEAEETIEGTDLEMLLSAIQPEVEMFGNLLVNGNGHRKARVAQGVS
jgi:cell division protease FtsH